MSTVLKLTHYSNDPLITLLTGQSLLLCIIDAFKRDIVIMTSVNIIITIHKVSINKAPLLSDESCEVPV